MKPMSVCSQFALIAILLACCSSGGQAQKKRTTVQRLNNLDETVKTLEQKGRDLEARIAVLERLNLTPSPDVLRASYYRASRDAITNVLVNIGASAYQYRIRPSTMGGGGGTYAGYKIPRRMASDENDTIAAAVFPDSIVLKGVWKKGSGTVQCTVNDTGRTVLWMYSGDFE